MVGAPWMSHENENGVLSAEDNETYGRMEKEIEDLTNAIDRQQRAEAREVIQEPVITYGRIWWPVIIYHATWWFQGKNREKIVKNRRF